jgi:hypothetical protein
MVGTFGSIKKVSSEEFFFSTMQRNVCIFISLGHTRDTKKLALEEYSENRNIFSSRRFTCWHGNWCNDSEFCWRSRV